MDTDINIFQGEKADWGTMEEKKKNKKTEEHRHLMS